MGRQVRFDRFRFDPETLWAGAQEVRLTPKSAAVMTLARLPRAETKS
jgi:hypothetical protein